MEVAPAAYSFRSSLACTYGRMIPMELECPCFYMGICPFFFLFFS